MFSRKLFYSAKKIGAVILSVCMIASLFAGLQISTAVAAVVSNETAIYVGNAGNNHHAAAFIPVDIAIEDDNTADGNALEGEQFFKVQFKCRMLSGTKPVIGVYRVDADGSDKTYSEPDWCDQNSVTVENGICTADIKVVFNKRFNRDGFRSFYLAIGNSYYDGSTTTAADFDDAFIMSDVKLFWIDPDAEPGTEPDYNVLPEFNSSNINFNGTFFFDSNGCDKWDSPASATAGKWNILSSPSVVKKIEVPADFNTSDNYAAENFVKIEETDLTREYYTNENYADLIFGKLKASNDAGFEIISKDINKKMIIIDANHEGEDDINTATGKEAAPKYNRAANIFLPISYGQYNMSGSKRTDGSFLVKVTFNAKLLEGDSAPVIGRIVGKKTNTGGKGSQALPKMAYNIPAGDYTSNQANYSETYKDSEGNRLKCEYDAKTGEFVGWMRVKSADNDYASCWGCNEIITIGNAEHVYAGAGKFDSTSFNSSFAISNIKVDLYECGSGYVKGELVAEDIAPALTVDNIDTTTRHAYQYVLGSEGGKDASNNDVDCIRAPQNLWSAEGNVGMVHTENLTACISEGHTLTHHEATDVTREYWSCSCGKNFKEAYAKTEITDLSAKNQMIYIAASSKPASAFLPIKLCGFEGNRWFKFTCKAKLIGGESTPVVSTLYNVYNGSNQCETTITTSNDGDFAVFEVSYDPETCTLTAYIKAWIKDIINQKDRYPFERMNPLSGANCAIVLGNGRYLGTGYAEQSTDTDFAFAEPELYMLDCTEGSSALATAKESAAISENLIAPMTDKTIDLESEYVATWTNANNPVAAPVGSWYRTGADKANVSVKDIPANYFTPGYVPCEHAASHVVEAVASTCHTQGHGAYTVCDNCGEVLEGSDTPLPLDPNNHDGGTEIRNAVPASCMAAGYTGDTYCLGCETKIAEGTTIDMLAHTPGNTVNENVVPATCGANGSHDEVVYCTECETELSRVTKTDLATGNHTVGDWNSDTSNHWHYCTVCEQNVDTAAHTLTWVVVTPATLEADGLKKEVCSVCGYETGNTEVINKLENHKPGDINDDGVVNNKDLTRLFQKLSGWNVKVNEAALDVNGDGKNNNKDITTLFKYLSGWDNITLS